MSDSENPAFSKFRGKLLGDCLLNQYNILTLTCYLYNQVIVLAVESMGQFGDTLSTVGAQVADLIYFRISIQIRPTL